MPDLDLFGLNEDPNADDPRGSAGPEEPEPAQLPARGFPWRALAAADLLLIIVCAAFLAQRLHARRESLSARSVASAPAASAPAQAPKPPAPAAPKEAPKPPPAEKEPEAPKPEPSPAAPAGEERGPIGSPSVHAPELPDRSASARPAPGQAPASPRDAAEPAEPARTTRPVTFTHSAPEAKEVYLVGPFLVRTDGRKAMTRDSRGAWRATVYLNIGYSYRYRFEVVDPQGRRSLTPNRSMDVF